MNRDSEFIKLAIENSGRSMEEGNFPAGGVVVKNGEILSSEVSSPFPNLFHADSKAISKAFEKVGPLTGATLYAGLESCLMCTGAAYWAGIRRIVYAIPKSKVSGNYYETPENTRDLITTFNEKIELIHLPEFKDEALAIIRNWEQKFLKK
ncbi:MAG TPA: deaminase [Xanthomonadales bacterium]|nr:deaminase [Xanthomonadales bacterium]